MEVSHWGPALSRALCKQDVETGAHAEEVPAAGLSPSCPMNLQFVHPTDLAPGSLCLLGHTVSQWKSQTE